MNSVCNLARARRLEERAREPPGIVLGSSKRAQKLRAGVPGSPSSEVKFIKRPIARYSADFSSPK